MKKLDWDQVAPGLLGSKLRAIAEKAGSLEARAGLIKEALSAVETRHASTLVGFKMAGGFLEKAAFKAGVARELAKLVPGEASGSLARMAAARQELVDVHQQAGEAVATLRDMAGKAPETPWALQQIREIERTAGTAEWELNQTESRGQMLATMDAGVGLLTEAPFEAPAQAAPPSEAPAAAPSAEVEFTQEDLERIGTGLDPSKPPPQTNWSEQMVNTVCELGRRQGGVTDEQGGRNFELAKVVLGSSEGQAGAKPLEAADLAAVLKMTGVDLTKVDPNQLQSAAKYVSGATTLTEQQDKLRKTIENFQVLEKIGLPKLTRQQMVDELWGVAKVPGHALAKLSDADVAKKLQEVLGTVNAGPGKSEIKIGKYNLKLEVGQSGTVEKSSCKKPSFFSKIVKITKIVTPIALTILSFTPLAPFALAAQGVIAMVQAIKAKSILGIAAAGASLFGGGSMLAQAASRALQGVSQIKSGNWVGGLASIGSGAASGIKALAAGAQAGLKKVGENLGRVSTKLSAVGTGVVSFEAYKKAGKAVEAAKEALQAAQAKGDGRAIAAAQKQLSQAETQKRAALIGGAAGAATAASALAGSRSLFRGQSGSVRPAQTALERNLQFTSRALGVAQGVAGKDYTGAAVSAFSLGATVNSAKKGGVENRLNDAANIAQAGLGYYQGEKGRKAANQAVSDAQKRLDAAKRNGSPEVIRRAEADVKKAKGTAESALMSGMAAGESLLSTARDIGQTHREYKRSEVVNGRGTRLAFDLAESLLNGPDLNVQDKRRALIMLAELGDGREAYDEARRSGDPARMRAAREDFERLQAHVVSNWPGSFRVASVGVSDTDRGHEHVTYDDETTRRRADQIIAEELARRRSGPTPASAPSSEDSQGRKAGGLFEQLLELEERIVGAVKDKAGTLARGALAPKTDRRQAGDDLRAATQGTVAERGAQPLADRDIARQFQGAGEDVAREGSGLATRFSLESLVLDQASRATGMAIGIIKGRFRGSSYWRGVMGEGAEAGAMREVGAREAGFVTPPKHHLFPQEFRSFFEERGFVGDRSIDRYTVGLDETFHQAIHGGGNWRLGRQWAGEWNNAIMSEITRRERGIGHRLTFEEVYAIGRELKERYKIPGPVVPYRGK